MKVSIVIPSYNQGKFIEETLLSIFNQTYKEYEIIVIDGGSTDNTTDILMKYDDKIDFWISKKDDGQTDALIKGFSKANGDVYCWLCSDDLLEPDALENVITFFNKHPYEQVVTGNATWIDTEGIVLKRNKDIPFIKWIWLYTYNYIIQPSTFWKSGIYEQAGGLDPSKNLTMDADLWIRFAQTARINKLNKYLSRLRLYPDQKNVKFRDESNLEDIQIRKAFGVNRETVFSKYFLSPIAYSCRILLKCFNGSYFSTNYFKNISLFRISK